MHFKGYSLRNERTGCIFLNPARYRKADLESFWEKLIFPGISLSSGFVYLSSHVKLKHKPNRYETFKSTLCCCGVSARFHA